jgi:hypothetical protein
LVEETVARTAVRWVLTEADWKVFEMDGHLVVVWADATDDTKVEHWAEKMAECLDCSMVERWAAQKGAKWAGCLVWQMAVRKADCWGSLTVCRWVAETVVSMAADWGLKKGARKGDQLVVHWAVLRVGTRADRRVASKAVVREQSTDLY